MRRIDWLVLDYEFDQLGTICVRLANGPRQIEIVADIEVGQRRVVLHRPHVSGAGPNTMGPAALQRPMRWAKERLDVDELRIEGAARTSGANPGRFPRALVIRRVGCRGNCAEPGRSTRRSPSRGGCSRPD
jgi:hypothetical protein